MSDDCGIPGYLLWRAANLWQKKVRSVLSPFDITPVQYLLLVGLRNLQEETGGPVKQADLARHCQSDPMMTSQVLRALQKAGMIHRHTHAADGRASMEQNYWHGRNRRSPTRILSFTTRWARKKKRLATRFGYCPVFVRAAGSKQLEARSDRRYLKTPQAWQQPRESDRPWSVNL